MSKLIFRKALMMFVFAGIFICNLNAEFNVIPQLDFGMLQLEEDSYIYSPAGSLGFKYTKNEASEAGGPDVVAGSLSYGQDIFSDDDLNSEENIFINLGLSEKLLRAKILFF